MSKRKKQKDFRGGAFCDLFIEFKHLANLVLFFLGRPVTYHMDAQQAGFIQWATYAV